MGELLLETLLDIIFGVVRFVFFLPGQLVTGMTEPGEASEIGRRWFKGWSALFISLTFWFMVGLLIYFFTQN